MAKRSGTQRATETDASSVASEGEISSMEEFTRETGLTQADLIAIENGPSIQELVQAELKAALAGLVPAIVQQAAQAMVTQQIPTATQKAVPQASSADLGAKPLNESVADHVARSQLERRREQERQRIEDSIAGTTMADVATEGYKARRDAKERELLNAQRRKRYVEWLAPAGSGAHPFAKKVLHPDFHSLGGFYGQAQRKASGPDYLLDLGLVRAELARVPVKGGTGRLSSLDQRLMAQSFLYNGTLVGSIVSESDLANVPAEEKTQVNVDPIDFSEALVRFGGRPELHSNTPLDSDD